jgi:hypothetical protein
MKVYVLQASNRGTPEANEIIDIFETLPLAKRAMKNHLEEEGISESENENEGYYYISKRKVIINKK